MRREIIRYNNKLKDRANELRNTMTPAECILWEKIRKKQVLGINFNRQAMINNFIVDFYSRDIKLAIEVDGKIHDEKKEYDFEREVILRKLGVDIIRFTNEEVEGNVDSVINKIKKYIEGMTNLPLERETDEG
jgi:very-short-patch-repair endonuclease